MSDRLTTVVRALPSMIPFVAPEELERQLGVKFRARLGANESVWGPSSRVTEAISRVSPQNYGDPQSQELRSALSSLLGVKANGVVVGGGIDGLLMVVARAYLETGRCAVTTHGSYPTWNYAVAASGASLHEVPYSSDAPDLEGLARKAHETSAAIVYLANPDNPSGRYLSAAEIHAFRASLPDPTLLVLDEAYADFVPSASLPSFSESDEGVIRLRTFSKAHSLAGLRVGYAFGASETIQPLNRIRAHFEVNAMAQAAALASLADTSHLARVVAANEGGREELVAIGTSFGLKALPSATNFVTFDVGTKEAADQLLADLLNQGVFIRKPAKPPLDRCIRITIGSPEDHGILREALANIRG